MSDEKAIRIVEFSGKKPDFDGWSEKHMAKAQYKGYRKLLLGKKKEKGFDIVPTEQDIIDIEAKQSQDEMDKKIIQLDKLNRQAFMDLILSINTNTNRGKIAFRLVKNCKTSEYPEGNCKMAWDRLVAKFAPRSTPSLLKLQKEYENSKLESSTRDPEDWISELEGLRIDIELIESSSAISERNFMVKILNNLPSEYDVILDGLENRLALKPDDENALTVDGIREKVNNRYERIRKNAKIDVAIEENDRALVSVSFKGTCNKCGKYGHKGVGCPNGNENALCWYCKRTGHRRDTCELLLKHKAEINEQANIAVSESDEESNDQLCF